MKTLFVFGTHDKLCPLKGSHAFSACINSTSFMLYGCYCFSLSPFRLSAHIVPSDRSAKPEFSISYIREFHLEKLKFCESTAIWNANHCIPGVQSNRIEQEKLKSGFNIQRVSSCHAMPRWSSKRVVFYQLGSSFLSYFCLSSWAHFGPFEFTRRSKVQASSPSVITSFHIATEWNAQQLELY